MGGQGGKNLINKQTKQTTGSAIPNQRALDAFQSQLSNWESAGGKNKSQLRIPPNLGNSSLGGQRICTHLRVKISYQSPQGPGQRPHKTWGWGGAKISPNTNTLKTWAIPVWGGEGMCTHLRTEVSHQSLQGPTQDGDHTRLGGGGARISPNTNTPPGLGNSSLGGRRICTHLRIKINYQPPPGARTGAAQGLGVGGK